MTAPYRKVNYGKVVQKYALIVSLLFLAPVVLIALGALILSTSDRRVSSILLYNDRIIEWQSIESEFRNASFLINSVVMDPVEMPQLNFFPIADACNKTEDPLEGCLYSDSLYYSYNYTVIGDFFNFTVISDNGNAIISEHVPIRDISRIEQRKLNCWDRESCEHACRNLQGKWDVYTNECIVTRHLQSICYRVAPFNGSYALDKSETISAKSAGCFYSNFWSPYLYSEGASDRVITVNIRHYLDPVISASDETRGCSDDKWYRKDDCVCFGASKYNQSRSGEQMLIIGVVFLILEIIIISTLFITYIYKNRRINPKIQLSESLEELFVPYSVDELVSMHSPHVDEIREWTASRKHLISE